MAASGLVVDGQGITTWFGAVTALDRVDLAVRAGEVHGLLGANGAGKSTLLSVLFGLTSPQEGSLRLFGQTRGQAGAAWLDRVGGFVEAPSFYPYLSGRQNLAVLARLDGGYDSAPIDELLELVSLASAAGRRVRGYSLGMRQRLGVAAALLRRPRLLIVDEPTNGMDPAGIRDLRLVVRRLADDGVAVVLSSHDMTQVSELCDTVTVLDHGRVVFAGDLDLARAAAPDPSWRLTTSDDRAAATIGARSPGLLVGADHRGGLRIVAGREPLDAYVVELGRTGVAIRALAEDVTALEALFFSLSESAPTMPAPRTLLAVPSPADVR